MRRLIWSLTFAWCGVWVGACGSGSSATTNGSYPSFTSVSGGNSPVVVRGLNTLKGDEDDDEAESRTSGVQPKGDDDNDTDNDVLDNSRNGYYDSDDGAVTRFGSAADARDAYVLTMLVRRYYAAAVAGDGKAACSLIDPRFAGTIAETYGRPPGPSYLRGAATCSAVMSLLFKHEHRLFTPVRVVTGVRLDRDEAFVLLGSKTAPASSFMFKRSGGSWRLAAIGGMQLP
jgi:hypothetical protein